MLTYRNGGNMNGIDAKFEGIGRFWKSGINQMNHFEGRNRVKKRVVLGCFGGTTEQTFGEEGLIAKVGFQRDLILRNNEEQFGDGISRWRGNDQEKPEMRQIRERHGEAAEKAE